MPIEHISAVTFAVHDMARSVGFYQKLGFTLVENGSAEFTSLRAGNAFVNLATAMIRGTAQPAAMFAGVGGPEHL